MSETPGTEAVDNGEQNAMIEGGEPAHHHHHSAGIKWFDVAMTLSILLVSIASVVISLHTGSTMAELVHENARLVRANSTPVLSFTTGNTDDQGKRSIGFTLSNSGTGPARVVWFEIANSQGAQLGAFPWSHPWASRRPWSTAARARSPGG